MSFLPALLGGAAAVGGVLENTKGARTSTGNLTPTVSPEYKTLADLLRGRAEDRLRSNVDMSGYTTNGISNINDAYKGVNMAAGNNLTARGLASSPVAATVDQSGNLTRGGDIAQFLNTIPLLQRQFQNEDMTTAGNVLKTGTGTATTNVGAGSPVAGGISSAAEMLAYLKGLGVF